MNFEKALKKVKKGKGMRLPFWKSDVCIFCQYPDDVSKMTAPYLYVDSRFGRVPWNVTFIEMFNPDWEISDPEADLWDDDLNMVDMDWNETPTTIAEPLETNLW